MYDLCIKNGMIVNHDHSIQGTVYIRDGKISDIIEKDEAEYKAKKTIDAKGKYVMPGFIDPHSHLNDPGYTAGEDFYTGTSAAAAGGITTVMEHPLTIPLPSNAENLIAKKEIVGRKAVTDFALFGACTPDNFEQLGEMIDAGAVAFKAFLTSSPEMPNLSDAEILQHMEELKGKGPVMPIHCENEGIINVFTEKLQAEGRIKPLDYHESRPAISEIEAVNRMCLFAEHTGGKVHVVHCSVPEGVDIVTAYREKGVDITVETCPHFLMLDHDDVRKWGVYAICNPPIRDRTTVEQLWERIFAGKIDFIGSDHAPYTFEEKEQGLENVFKTPAGLSGIQTCFPSFFSEGVIKRGLSPEIFVAMTSANAAKRYGLFPKKGILKAGSDADLVILDPEKSWNVTKDKLFYKMKWTPYMDMTITGQIEKTIVRGVVVYGGGEICVAGGFGEFVPAQNAR